ncbi:diaminopimelate epimerase [uncultured Alistipes sp.]|uniref:diaminopimelate epimerase n=1 Tax=uncultured Alistipes sp. TaxID=538949 RepID=UPI0026140571|nr:diaminopimelate epimerase [uncultured Alistipes sp.]
MMRELEYIRCHGSGNRFVMIDAVRCAAALEGCDLPALARAACRLDGGTDGLLLLAGGPAEWGMRMFNPDGSEAEMCGNGIRCVARLADERYLRADRFALVSGGRSYAITREEPLAGAIPAYGVRIPVGRSSADYAGGESIGGAIPELDPALEFTYLHLGNPHLAARVGRIDMELLRRLGERVATLGGLFPRGVNVSLFRVDGRRELFVATYERGAGITESCGTAMTASSTAACLLGCCDFDADLAVRNRGGMVRCLCRRDARGALSTRLAGNATFEAEAVLRFDGGRAERLAGSERPRAAETAAYDAFRRTVAEDSPIRNHDNR